MSAIAARDENVSRRIKRDDAMQPEARLCFGQDDIFLSQVRQLYGADFNDLSIANRGRHARALRLKADTQTLLQHGAREMVEQFGIASVFQG